MGIKNVAKKVVTLGIDVKRWVGLKQIQHDASLVQGLWKNIKKSKTPSKKVYTEKKASNILTKKESQKRKVMALFLSILYFASSIIIITYGWHLISEKGLFISSITCCLLAAIVFLNGIKEHLVYYQIKHQRFDLKLKDWFDLTFLRKEL